LTAIFTVAVEGGGSGVLLEDLGMPPPGDIRNCMEALADTESLMQQLLAYRFPDGRLAGQAFGNLLLAALDGVCDSFDQAVARMSEVLAITGRILPVTNANVQLEASFENGSSVCGESKISAAKKEQNCRIHHVRLLPEHTTALPAALDAIRRAEVILLGPGSLYTSVIPNLLVDGVSEAIADSPALKIYVCNIMTQDGETEGMTAQDHVSALLEHGGPGLVDLCLCNSDPISGELLERYSAEDAEPMRVDRREVELLGAEVVYRPLMDMDCGYARHSGVKVAQAVVDLYQQRADTKIF
ncbi:MAG: YvcK family protein, partial [Oscillospiraceae bacterium]|nr:YvcK family protein [Oscillospiraceae bacterium]